MSGHASVQGTGRSSCRPTGQQVRVRAATKRYERVRALDAIDLDVTEGQFLVLLGPSGSGKSTLLRVLAGIERLDEGELCLDGHLVADRHRHLPPERRDLAMVFQDYALWPHLTAAGNVAYALRRRRLDPARTRTRVGEALERVGLSELADRYPHELSGGEQQRVALARAVVARPGLLLFDEPLSNLDTDLRERLRVEIATLTRESGATAVYITHDQVEAFALADRVGILDRGRLVQLDHPERIYHRPASSFVARFTGLAGELTGHVTDTDHDMVTVQVADRRLRALAIEKLTVDQPVSVAIRPAATHIDGSGNDDLRGRVPGVVADVAYRGRGYDHVVTGLAGTLTSVFDTAARPRGTSLEVALDPAGCMAYPTSANGTVQSSQ